MAVEVQPSRLAAAAAAAHIFTSAERLQDPHRPCSFPHQLPPLLFCFWGHLVLIKAGDLSFWFLYLRGLTRTLSLLRVLSPPPT